MRSPTAATVALATAFLSLAPAAGAATVQIGAVGEIGSDTPPDPVTAAAGAGTYTVQVAEAGGTYAVPPGYGVITAWSHRTGGFPGSLTFKVYRPTGPPGQFLALAGDTRTVATNARHSFPVRIRVQPGDRIGISTTSVQVAYNTLNPADQLGFFRHDTPDPPPGSLVTQDGPPFRGYRADVAARVETDADRDGFGDDSQDPCPTVTGPNGTPCPPPQRFAGCSARAANVIRGTGAANRITGTPLGDRIFAGGGNDRVAALAGVDCLDLGSGADRGLGGAGADRVVGGGGRDRISGGSGGDVIVAGSSADRVAGDGGGDRIGGNSGNDSLKGGSGGDRINGGSGGDRISGGSGQDVIRAGDRRRDRISCGRGRDRVVADRVDRVSKDCERVRR